MAVITENPDVGLRPLLRFAQQFKNTDPSNDSNVLKPNLELLVRTFTQELQELESALVGIMYNLAVFDFLDVDGNVVVDSAYGESLDMIAKVVGAEPRQGMSDDQYRAEIALQIAINTSKGNIGDVINALKKITQASVVEWTDNFPAGVDFVTNGNYAGAEVISQITQILSAAVGFSLTYKNEDVGVFEFSDSLSTCAKKLYCSATDTVDTIYMADPNHPLRAGATIIFENGINRTVASVSGGTVVLTAPFSGTTSAFTWINIVYGGIAYSPNYSKQRSHSELYSIFSNTVSVTNGSDTVSIDTADETKLYVGDYVYFNEDSFDTYQVLSIDTVLDTITLARDYDGVTDATANIYIERRSKVLTGTVDIVGTAVTYNDATDYAKVYVGDHLFFNNSITGYLVDSVSGTGCTLSVSYGTASNLSCNIVPHSGALVDIFF